MQKKVPDKAAKWMLDYLRESNISITDEKESMLNSEKMGIGALTVLELRIIVSHFENILNDKKEQDSVLKSRFKLPKARAAKPAWMVCVKRCFYIDDECTTPVPDDDAIYSLIATEASPASDATGNGGGAKKEDIDTSSKPAASSLSASKKKKKGGGQRRAPSTGPQFSLG